MTSLGGRAVAVQLGMTWHEGCWMVGGELGLRNTHHPLAPVQGNPAWRKTVLIYKPVDVSLNVGIGYVEGELGEAGHPLARRVSAIILPCVSESMSPLRI